MYSAMFGWLSDGWLPSVYRIRSVEDLALMYQVYASAFASMALISSALNRRAWVRRDSLQLDELERLLLQRHLFAGAFLIVVAVASFVAATALRQGLPAIAYSAPGMLYMLLALQPLLGRYRREDERRLRAATADAGS